MTPTKPSISTRSVEWIVHQYGQYLDTKKISQLLGYSSPKAVRRANKLGSLGFPLHSLNGRRGLFASAEDISSHLNRRYTEELATTPLTFSDH